MPPAAAAQLAYHAPSDLGVLAPRGWQCLGLYGSNGSILDPSGDANLVELDVRLAAGHAGLATAILYAAPPRRAPLNRR